MGIPCAVLWLGAVLLQNVAARQTPVFRGATDVVPLFATVRGADGHLVTGLTKADFQLFDNGRPVPIDVFSRDVQPLALSVLVDVSGGFIDHTVFANLRASINGLIDVLDATDRMRMGTFAFREIGMAAELTVDKAVLRRVVAEELWPGGGARPLWNAVFQGIAALRDPRAIDVEGSARPERRVVLALTSGPNGFSMRGQPGFRAVRQALEAGDVMFYAVVLAPRGPGVSSGDRGNDENTLAAVDRVSALTGGGSFTAPYGRNLGDVLKGVVEELRHQYAIGFTPAVFDDRVHKLELRVTGSGRVVRTRTEYVARRRTP